MPGASFTDVSWAFDTSEFGSAATWTAQGGSPVAGVVLFDAPGALVLDDVMATDYLITYATATWPTVADRDVVTIGAVQYLVRQVMPLDDGRLARAALKRLS